MTPTPPEASLEALHRRSLAPPFTPFADYAEHGPVVMKEGRGVRLVDARGREYIDALAGLWCVDVGYGRAEIADAMAEQGRRLPYSHSFFGMGNEPSVLLADRLLSMSPWPMRRVFFGLSGSDGNDTQIKLVWLYQALRGKPDKRKIVARRRAYHGVTVAAASATGLPAVHAGMGLPLPHFVHVTAPHAYREAKPGESEAAFVSRLADELDGTIRSEGPETVGAFIAEPVMGAGGVLVPPAGYFEAVQQVLRHHDVLLVSDEVICGFGRLGRPFGGQRYGIEPDLVTLAKGLTSGYAPLSACLIGERVWAEIEAHAGSLGQLAHGFTYGGHPVCAAAAMANLDLLEREGLYERASVQGESLQGRLREALGDHPAVGEVRGVGLIAAVELVADRDSREPFPPERRVGARVYRELLRRGVIVRAIGDSLALCPPYIVDDADLERVVDALSASIDAVTAGGS